MAIYKREQRKKAQRYTSYLVPDYSSGQRVLKSFASLPEAKQKAHEIAEGTAEGKTDFLSWADDLRVEIRKSLEALEPTGLTLLPASQLLAEAVKILGGHSELLAAC